MRKTQLCHYNYVTTIIKVEPKQVISAHNLIKVYGIQYEDIS